MTNTASSRQEHMSQSADAVRFTVEDGVAHLVLDDPHHSANTMNQAYTDAMTRAVDRLVQEVTEHPDQVRGVIVSSAKKTFFAGGDLASLVAAGPADARAFFDQAEKIKRDLRRLETIGRPVVAAINGAALGGGLEIALACHHRIAVAGRYDVGLPEATLGLLPGGGGVARTVRMLGVERALEEVLLQGQRMKPEQAKTVGLIDTVVASEEELLTAARTWIRAGDADAAIQPWDRPGFTIPGGSPSEERLQQKLPLLPALLRKRSKGAPYRAPRNILCAAVEGARVDFDTAARIESRYFVDLVVGPQSTNMTQAFFFDMASVNAGGSRPSGIDETRVERLAVVGAGMMGAGIAYSSAKAGIEVVLKDIDDDAAHRGKDYSTRLLDKDLAKGRISPAQREEVLGRIHPTTDYADLNGCDFVVEAVYESVDLKHQVFAETERAVDGTALLGSNTSTLPITMLANGSSRPADFIGVHFFSPVERMPLVEIIVGEKTSDAAIARAVDYARQIRKSPIVVNDHRGFFTSRVFGSLVMEGAELLSEGVDPVTIERAATLAGFPGQPLAMLDEVALTLPLKIRDEAVKAGDSDVGAFRDSPGMDLLTTLVELNRPGKAAGAGFYEYPDTGRKFLWPGLWERFTSTESQVPLSDVKERLTFIMSLDTVRCLEQGVLRAVPDANIGSILGIGFPTLHGGALQYINGYQAVDGQVGVNAFTERARTLAAKYGDRFDPPQLLLDKAAAGAEFR